MTAGPGALARAQSVGVDGTAVDGNNVFEVDAAAAALLERIRGGGGPAFLHAVTYRFKGHVSVDPATYRDGEEVARALEDDPIKRVAQGLPQAELARIRREAEDEVRAALTAASAAPWPQPASAYTDIQDTGSGRWRG
jgi:pyruvate dehydrogenase E1 component alpha subunit